MYSTLEGSVTKAQIIKISQKSQKNLTKKSEKGSLNKKNEAL